MSISTGALCAETGRAQISSLPKEVGPFATEFFSMIDAAVVDSGGAEIEKTALDYDALPGSEAA